MKIDGALLLFMVNPMVSGDALVSHGNDSIQDKQTRKAFGGFLVFGPALPSGDTVGAVNNEI